MLRFLVGSQLSLCDYRELLRSELGNFSSVLAAADANDDLKAVGTEIGDAWHKGIKVSNR